MAESKSPDPFSSSKSTSESYVKGVRYPNPPEYVVGGPEKVRYPNPPDRTNPDLPTLRDQFRFAGRLFSKWHAYAWAATFLAGTSAFALGWYIKGSNPFLSERNDPPSSSTSPDVVSRTQ